MNDYSWSEPYRDAALETDPHKRPEKIADAERAIKQRLAVASPPEMRRNEWDAIAQSLAALTVLKNEAGENTKEVFTFD